MSNNCNEHNCILDHVREIIIQRYQVFRVVTLPQMTSPVSAENEREFTGTMT